MKATPSRKPLVLFAVLAAFLVACTALHDPAEHAASSQQATATSMGAELWGQTCNRCHNFRSPTSLTDSQWDVVLMHMRLRANLTGEEQRAILEFLKTGN